jgi:hypothetical protein
MTGTVADLTVISRAPRWHAPLAAGAAAVLFAVSWGLDPLGRLLVTVAVLGLVATAWVQRPGPLLVLAPGEVRVRGLTATRGFPWNQDSVARLLPGRGGTRPVALELDPGDGVLPASVSLWRVDRPGVELLATAESLRTGT